MLNKTHRDTESFLRQIQNLLPVFDSNALPQEPLPKERWAQLMDEGICLPAIPVSHEGRHNHREMCEVIEMMSEYNLPLGMYTMIVTVLFLRNVALSGSSRLQAEVFEDFLENPVIGGIAFTEPEHGSSLSRMKTTYEEQDGSYYVRGSKHWQAFSAQADWWIVCARQYAGKQFGYFVHRRSDGGFVTTEVYDSLGLKNLGYGLNEIDIRVAPIGGSTSVARDWAIQPRSCARRGSARRPCPAAFCAVSTGKRCRRRRTDRSAKAPCMTSNTCATKCRASATTT